MRNHKNVALKASLIFAVTLILSTNLYAADFSFQKNLNNRTELVIAGEIRAGDDEKLLALIRDDLTAYLQSDRIIVNSLGGDVDAAIKLANLIEQSGVGLDVDNGDICASACFLLYVSAPLRMARPGSQVIVHRPYYDMKNAHGSTQAQSAAAYQNANLLMRDYLISRAVPNYLIDKMMQMPSSQGYLLTIEDLVALDSMSTPVQEYAIQNCGYVSTRSPGSIECIKDYFRASRYAFIAKHVQHKDSQSSISVSLAMEEFHNWMNLMKATDPDFEEKANIVTENIQFESGMDQDQRIRAFKKYYESL